MKKRFQRRSLKQRLVARLGESYARATGRRYVERCVDGSLWIDGISLDAWREMLLAREKLGRLKELTNSLQDELPSGDKEKDLLRKLREGAERFEALAKLAIEPEELDDIERWAQQQLGWVKPG